jgi:uncharacterized membrane protein YeaQ/YmgE (transglycosylase-associated protein family)
MLLLLEMRRVLFRRAPGELPFMLVALVQYYVFLCAPVFSDRPFKDLNGPVQFSDAARNSAGYAIAGGAVLFVVARWAVSPLATALQRALLRLLPRRAPGGALKRALWVYLLATMSISAILATRGNLLPSALVMPLYVTVSFPLALGLWFSLAPRMSPRSTTTGLAATVLLGTMNGLVAGFLQPMFRIGLAFMGGIWAKTQRAPVAFVVAIVVAYFLLNPVKFLYRQIFWYGEGASGGYVDHLEGMGDAAADYWTGGERRDDDVDQALERVSELNQVIFVFDAVPRRTPFLDGVGWVALLTAPIPRLLWPGKPDYRQVTQTFRYRTWVTPENSKSSFVMPLHVDGYWNLGWLGIAMACLMMGAYLALAEKVFVPKHWALTAMGVAHFAEISSYVNVGRIYMSLFQLFVGHLVVIWLIHRASHMLGNGPRRA